MARSPAIPADNMTPKPQSGADPAEPHNLPPAVAAAEPPPAAATERGRIWAANALVAVLTAALTVVGGGLTALLIHEFGSIDARFGSVDARFDAVDARFDAVDARFDAVDARFDSLEEGQDEIARTLAVLVADLNARAAVDAALAGRLLTFDSADPPAEPEGAEP